MFLLWSVSAVCTWQTATELPCSVFLKCFSAYKEECCSASPECCICTKMQVYYLGAWDKWKGCVKEEGERTCKGICSCYLGFGQYIVLLWNLKETSCTFRYELKFQFINTVLFFTANGFNPKNFGWFFK